MKYWQIGIGDGQVDMLEIFLKLKLALIGPGRIGDYFDNQQAYINKGIDGKIIKRFAEDVQIGDVFVLKHIENPQSKTWRIFAVGKVAGPYRYEPIFDKVDQYEWDVQHCRRVLWSIPKKTIIVQNGGAPIRFQRMDTDNPLVRNAIDILNGKIAAI